MPATTKLTRGVGQAGGEDGFVEEQLELRAGEGHRLIEGQGSAQRLAAAVAPVAREHVVDRGEVEELAFFGALEQLLEAAFVDKRRLVEEHAGDGGDRDPLAKGAVGVGQGAGAVQANRRAARARARGRDVDRDRLGQGKAPEPHGGVVTQQRPGSASEHGSKALPVKREIGVPDGVDAVVEAVQVTGGDKSLDRVLRVAEKAPQLPDRDNAVLPLRQVGEIRATLLTFPAHTAVKLNSAVNSPPG